MTTPSRPGMHREDPGDRFDILVVCTANLCRSPMAAALLGARLPPSAGWRVMSAGTRADNGLPMHPLAAAALGERGLDAPNFRTSTLTIDMIARANLVLTAERSHRADVVRLRPPAVRYTFTLREFGRLLAGATDCPSRIAAVAGPWLIATATGNRIGVDPRLAHADDVEDPIGGKIRAFRRCADTLDGLATAIARTLASAT